MRWSKPCVGSNAGGIPDVINPSCAMLPEPGDAQALAQALHSLITQPALRLQLGQAGKARFLAHFSMHAYTQRLLAAIA
jgi:glycosyltransferase involved in cell wall biosynthesis